MKPLRSQYWLMVLAVLLASTPAGLAQASDAAANTQAGSLPVGSSLSVRLVDVVDSGSKKNGDVVHAVLAAPVKTATGTKLQAGTPVTGTVVSCARAGEMQSAGVLSLQLTEVAGVPVISDVLDFSGQEGHRDLADSAPAKGTEARVQAGSVLKFKVMEDGRATGLDLADAARARAEGTVGAGAQKTATRSSAKSSGDATGLPYAQPGAGQTAIPGATTPH